MTTRPDKIRVAMLKRPDLFDAIRLTNAEREAVIDVMMCGPVTSAQLADYRKAGVHGVSGRLRVAWEKGYLERRQEVAVTGGIEYVYSFNLEEYPKLADYGIKEDAL